MAEDMDSPVAVTRAESYVIGITSSIEAGLEANLLHGPGESPDMRGEGRGVTSEMAFSMGEDTTEFDPELRLVLLPKLLARTFFTLGVRCMVIVFGAGCSSTGFGAAGVTALAAVTVYPGMSVWMRRLALSGLELALGVFREAWRREVVSSARGSG